MIYLDNAATSFPKPPEVIDAQTRCMRYECGNPGRGSHRLAMLASGRIYECRTEIASLFGAPNPANVIFTMNTTMALNMAIKGLIRKGDHVLISDMEHNAVFRPICKLARMGMISYDIFPTMVLQKDRTPADICHAIEGLIRPRTRLLICSHASNICSSVLPLEEIGALCHRFGILFVVDGAQSAGHIPIDMEGMQIDALCAPGHKGLLGPQGSGFLILGQDIVADTLIEGGSGYQSLEGSMPQEAPERYEAGTLPTPAIAGLCAGVRKVKSIGVEKIGRQLREWNLTLQDRLCSIPGVTVHTPHHVGSILLFHIDGISADRTGQMLDRLGFCVRAGYHCSALGHTTLHTPVGGAVRVSPGIFNTPAQISSFVDAVKELCP